MEFAERLQKGFLGNIFCFHRVAKNVCRGANEPESMLVDQLPKRVVVTFSYTPNEFGFLDSSVREHILLGLCFDEVHFCLQC